MEGLCHHMDGLCHHMDGDLCHHMDGDLCHHMGRSISSYGWSMPSYEGGHAIILPVVSLLRSTTRRLRSTVDWPGYSRLKRQAGIPCVRNCTQLVRWVGQLRTTLGIGSDAKKGRFTHARSRTSRSRWSSDLCIIGQLLFGAERTAVQKGGFKMINTGCRI